MSDWIEWEGNGTPQLEKWRKVRVRFGDGTDAEGTVDEFLWSHDDIYLQAPDRITAYIVHATARERELEAELEDLRSQVLAAAQ